MKISHSFPRFVSWIGLILLVTACAMPQSTPAAAPAAGSLTPSAGQTAAITATVQSDAEQLFPHVQTATPDPAAISTFVLDEYWPSADWRTSIPEEQGIDSTKLAVMMQEIQKLDYPLHSLLIIRNGYLVLEAYAQPFQAGSPHFMASVTKSVTSALIGIAIQQGKIDGVQHKLLDFFSDRKVSNLNAKKQAITLEHVLTMSSGLDWPTLGLNQTLGSQWEKSSDRVGFVLNRPMAAIPGKKFVYSTAGSHLLTTILKKTTGMSPLAYAQLNLFAPLGISNATWEADSNGIQYGGFGLNLTPRDMARIGYLYLHDGIWDGKSILPADWVKASTTGHIPTSDGLGSSYGYQWWVRPSGSFHAQGYGGQRIAVLPKQQMVVIFTGGFFDMGDIPEALLNTYIIPAAKSKGPLPPNPQQTTLLDSRVQTFTNPPARPVPALPATALHISGKTYSMQPNSLNIKTIRWSFINNQAEAGIYLDDTQQELGIGLDDLYRKTSVTRPDGSTDEYYIKGAWTNAGLFQISAVVNGSVSQVRFTFKSNKVEMRINNSSGIETVTGTVKP